jgi:WXG100 family type VII secretion target
MAGETIVNRAAMATAYRQVQEAVDQVKGQQSQLGGFQEQLQAGWVGEASSAFTGAYTAFNADFSKIIQALQLIQEKLVATDRKYTANETANTAAANRVMGMINR